ncbi:superoxide dismutase family protein [Tundrisphaera lichenicola]|uniref:superoxide dismutase family protein n=1 Tax=Tundrisphaera lichenicola TaxID=2029860 RepID=UPI003EBD2C24
MRISNLASAVVTAGAVVALAAVGVSAQHSDAKMEEPTKAVVVMIPTKSGGSVAGTIVFSKTEKGTRVEAEFTGLPAGKHGFHIHEFGDASSPDGKAAGGHFDPKMAKKHGDPSKADVRHLGDMGNIEANAEGKAAYDEIFPDLPIGLILGHGVVVHEKADDFGQPVGNAGGRLAVGVIGVAKGS